MTVVDAATLTAGQRLRADVVVVGSGPAGLTVALDLAAAGVDVLVLESGGTGPSAETRDLDEGDVVGTPLRFSDQPFGTADLRLRALGGASGIWTGMCRPLDEIDFRARPWVPGSGWPITKADLAPWYAAAESTLRLGTTGWEPEPWFARCRTTELVSSDRLRTTVFQFSPPVRFGTDRRAELDAPTGPRVVVGATAVDATLGPAGRRITELTLRRSDGDTFTAAADRFVLAAGGLEVPRLLLAWGTDAGIANSSGLVGQGYMDHPHLAAGQARVALDGPLPALYGYGEPPGDELPVRVWAGWSPTPELQEAEGIGHGVALLRFGDDRPESARADPSTLTRLMGDEARWSLDAPVLSATLSVRCEQQTSARSRVTLGSRLDATGLPRLRLDWRPGPDVGRTARRTIELLAEELGRAGVGRVEVEPRGRALSEVPLEIGCHPMGATRMGADPATSVVGPDLRAHDVGNLYVCSSSTFPTGGHANPTLTIVALAHRLAAELAR